MKAASFFDIDGTLYDGSVIGNFVLHLESEEIIDRQSVMEMKDIVLEYIRGRKKYRETAQSLLKKYASTLCGMSSSDIISEAESFSRELIFFDYAQPLVGLMKENDIMTVAVSGIPYDILVPATHDFGFDIVSGSILEKENDIYTGKIFSNLSMGEEKAREVLHVSNENIISLENSCGFGDTEEDIEYLGMMGNPVAINPTNALENEARKKGWHVFSKEDDIVSEMRSIIKENGFEK